MKWKISLFVILIAILHEKCDYISFNPTDKKNCIVSINGYCLDKEELKSVTQYYNKQDSERIAQSYIREWVIQQKLYEQAEKSISIDKAELEKSLTEFKQQYVISQYLKFYIQENLDTSVSDREMLQYYQQHKNSFKLTNNIIQIYYVKLNDNEEDIADFKKMLLSSNTKNKSQLNTFIIEKAISYFIEDSLWIKWDDVTREIPSLKTYDLNNLPKGKTIEWKDGTYYYYLKIKDYKVKDEYSPFIYEKEKIKKIILDERRNNLINELKKQQITESEYKEK
ncbi:MAG: hypothetical protein Fur0023_14600 [Bacteroidia bacterium]